LSRRGVAAYPLYRCVQIESSHPEYPRRTAVDALSLLPADASTPFLRKIVLDRVLDDEIRIKATECLGRHVDDETIKALMVIRDEPNRSERLWKAVTDAFATHHRFSDMPGSLRATIEKQERRLRELRALARLGIDKAVLPGGARIPRGAEAVMRAYVCDCISANRLGSLPGAKQYSIDKKMPFSQSGLGRTKMWHAYAKIMEIDRKRTKSGDE